MDRQQFIAELARLRPSSTFLTLRGYVNEASELADYSIAFHFSYEAALKKSIEVLSQMKLSTAMEKEARYQLLDSFATALTKGAGSPELEERDPTYTYFKDDDGNYIKGVKYHPPSDVVHLFGLVVHKRVLLPGFYPEKEKSLLTMAKDKLRDLTPVGKFRQFRITPFRVDYISVENLKLLPPNSGW